MSFEFIKKIIGVVSFAACFYNINTGHQGHRVLKVRGCVVMATKLSTNIPSALSYNHCVENNVIISLS